MFSRFRWFSAFSTRQSEWIAVIQATGFGGFLMLPPISLQGAPGAVAAAELTREANWGVLFFGLGGAAVYALHLGDRHPWVPFIRVAMMMAIIVLLALFAHGYLPWSPSAYWFMSSAFLLFGNGLLAASRDAGQEVRRWRQGDGDGQP